MKELSRSSTGASTCGTAEFTRRQVLASGAALATVSAFAGFDARPAAAALETQEALSVGYLAGSETAPNLRRLYLTALRNERRKGMEEIRIVPAGELPGDPRMQGLSVRMAIMGLYPSKSLDKSALPAAIDVDVLSAHPYGEKLEPLRHFAWSFRAKPWNESPPIRFRSYAEPDRGFGFEILERASVSKAGSAALRLLAGGRDTKAVTPAVRRSGWFAFGRESAQPRLQRGVYLLGLRKGAWDQEAVLTVSAARDALARLSIVVLVESADLPD